MTTDKVRPTPASPPELLYRARRSARILEGPPLEQFLVVSLFGLYFLRISSIQTGLPYFQLCYASLILLVLYVLVSGRIRVNPAGVVMLGLILPSAFQPGDHVPSLLRWCGWALIVAAVGPLLRGATPSQIRRQALRVTTIGLHIAVLTSIVMYFTGFSLGGRGGFSGVFGHAQALSQFSALAALDAYRRGGSGRSGRKWMLYAILAAIIMIVSGSRAGLAGAIAGFAAIAFLRGQIALLIGLIPPAVIGLVMLIATGDPADNLDHSQHATSSALHRIQEKGLENSRTEHWNARLKEFASSPLFGCGFQTAEGVGESVDDSGTVEPGSGYLSVPAMTGISGTFGFLIMFVSVVASAGAKWSKVPRGDRELLLSWGAVYAFLAISGGFFFAVGNTHTLLWWLLVGVFSDLPASASAPDIMQSPHAEIRDADCFRERSNPSRT